MVARVLLCTFILSLGSVARAQDLGALEKAIEQNPDDKAAYDAYALAAFKQKKWDDAIRRLKVGVARIPDYGDGYYKLAYAYRQKKEWADAADYYRRVIAIDPKNTNVYFGLAASLQGLGDRKGAIAAYERYISLEKAPDKQRFVDQAKAEIGKLDPSRAPAPPPAQVATPAPTPPPAARPEPKGDPVKLRAQGEQLRKDGKLEEAADAFRRAVEASPANVDLYNELGNVYFALKRYDAAAKAFQDATSRDPNYALGWYNLAHALRKGDRKQEAVQAYRSYMRLKPDDPDPYYGLGQTLKAMGDVAGAIEAFRKYVAMEKRSEEQRWVEKARAELEALEALQRTSGGRSPAGHGSGKIQEKGAGDDLAGSASERLERELERDRLQPFGDGIVDPFAREPSFRELRDPFDEAAPSGETQRLRDYGRAIEGFRRALVRHAEDVTVRYQRGVAFALAADARSALKAWSSLPLVDARVESARKSVERARKLVAHR